MHCFDPVTSFRHSIKFHSCISSLTLDMPVLARYLTFPSHKHMYPKIGLTFPLGYFKGLSKTSVSKKRFSSKYGPFPVFTISVNGAHIYLITEGRNFLYLTSGLKKLVLILSPLFFSLLDNTIVHTAAIAYGLVSSDPLLSLSRCFSANMSSKKCWNKHFSKFTFQNSSPFLYP